MHHSSLQGDLMLLRKHGWNKDEKFWRGDVSFNEILRLPAVAFEGRKSAPLQ